MEYCLYFNEQGTYKSKQYQYQNKYYISATNQKDKKDFNHPTIKPLELVKRHLLNTTQKGDTILDPFLGSGTTALACKLLERNCIGFEINEEYYKTAIARLEGKILNPIQEQLKLF